MNHKAQYDEHGNIILSTENVEESVTEAHDVISTYTNPYTNPEIINDQVWNVEMSEKEEVHNEPENTDTSMEVVSRVKRNRRLLPSIEEVKAIPIRLFSTTKNSIQHTANSFVEEGKNQYATSAIEGRETIKNVTSKAPKVAEGLWAFLAQPVWIISPNKKPKKRSRGVLFVTDVIRFGGTFAIIFGGLFVTLNYQSFTQIVGDNISPIQQAQRENEQQAELDSKLRTNILKSPSLAVAGDIHGDLLASLPSVGPPDNRIIVPKLGLNIPLVTPSYESLLKEDWDQVEADIQEALELGVVHYPGTARPGQAGNFFVTGHSSYYPWAAGNFKTVFARLHQLEIGDEYYVYYGGDKHRYVIREKKEVKPSNVNVLDQPLDRRIGTLMTCSPVGTTLRRLILIADEIHPETGMLMSVGEQHKDQREYALPEMLPI